MTPVERFAQVIFVSCFALTMPVALPAQKFGEFQREPSYICFAIRLVPGEVDPDRWGSAHHPPLLTIVDSAALTDRIDRLNFESAKDRRFPQAAALKDDTLELVWSDGLAGVRLRGLLQGSVYKGIARILTDVPPLDRQRDARFEALKITCPQRFRPNRGGK